MLSHILIRGIVGAAGEFDGESLASAGIAG